MRSLSSSDQEVRIKVYTIAVKGDIYTAVRQLSADQCQGTLEITQVSQLVVSVV